MATKVGSKGNIVIEKKIRARLGVEPGWEAIQVLREGYVGIHFLPPIQPGGSAGCLRSDGDTRLLATDEGFRKARELAMGARLAERFGDLAGEREP